MNDSFDDDVFILLILHSDFCSASLLRGKIRVRQWILTIGEQDMIYLRISQKP